jgi:hypothetical protein
MGSRSRDTIYGASVRAAAVRAAEARKQAGRPSCEAWNKRMLAFKGPAQPSPTLGDINQTVALDIIRRPKTTPINELECRMRRNDCSGVRDYAYKRSHLMALRPAKISASDPASTWWPGER